MFYLRAYYLNKMFWAFTSRYNNQTYINLTSDALAAEAFKPAFVEHFRQCVENVFPGSMCHPIECNSNEIIPEKMRKLMNIARRRE